jgi:hypothetical protein
MIVGLEKEHQIANQLDTHPSAIVHGIVAKSVSNWISNLMH